MTTRRISIRRERVAGWPIFRGLALPDGAAAISVEITRPIHQTIAHAVEDAVAVLGSALAALELPEQHRLWLVIAGGPIKRTDRVASYRAESESIWGVLRRQGVAVPPGPRADLQVPLPDDSFGPVGSVEVELGDLLGALTVTRLTDAVCLATRSPADPLPSLARRLAQHVGSRRLELLGTLVQMPAGWTFAARAFGGFDDHSVGVDVFASDTFLDALEPIMAAEAGVNSVHDA